MANKREEARDALFEKITEAVSQLGTQGYKTVDEASKLESLARAYDLVNGKGEPGKAW